MVGPIEMSAFLLSHSFPLTRSQSHWESEHNLSDSLAASEERRGEEMVYCSHCGHHCPSSVDPHNREYICCGICGKIIDDDIYSTQPTFVKDKSGQSRLDGTILRSIESGYSASHERTLAKGKDEIRYIVNCLDVAGGDSIIEEAHKFYQIAIDKNFTRGRRTTHVAAACLYIACWKNKKAYLLIDFSDYLQVNVYVLGAIFLKLCKILQLAEHPIIQKLVDPSLYIHRFTERLLGKKNNAISETALRIIASMKRDWMQTGRKPSGLCGAALYIAALSHGLDYSKSEIVNVVHVCEAMLTKRLNEFENNESSCLTFMTISGGLDGGAEPPAFQRAEANRLTSRSLVLPRSILRRSFLPSSTMRAEMKRKKAEMEESCSNYSVFDDETRPTMQDKNTGVSSSPDETQDETQTSRVTHKDGLDADVSLDEVNKGDDEPENFADIDDAEVNMYLLHNEEEKRYKKIIWEEMNKEYLEELALKEAAKKDAEDRQPQKVRKRKAEDDDKNAGPAKTPFEAMYNVLKKKGLASKVNLDAVGYLYRMDDTTLEEAGKEKEFPWFHYNDSGLHEPDVVEEFLFC